MKNEKRVFNGVVFNVDEVKVEVHKKMLTRQVVRHAPVVVIVAVNNDNKVLLTSEYRIGPNEVTTNLPAGFIDEGETPEQAALRELREETGFVGTDPVVMTKIYSSEGFTDEAAYLVFVHYDMENVGTHFDSDEYVNHKEVDFEQAKRMVLNGEIKSAQSTSAILLADNYLREGM